MNEYRHRNAALCELAAAAVLISSSGFPGNYSRLFGSWLEPAVEYGVFLLEIVVMLLSGGSSVTELRLIDLKKKYAPLYLFAGIVFLSSMLVTRYRSAQFITCFRLMVLIFFVIWVTDQFSPLELMSLFCRSQAVLVILTVVYTLLNPGRAFNAISGEMAFVGLHSTKNVAACQLAFGLLLYLVYYRQCFHHHLPVPRWAAAFTVVQLILLLLCRATGAVLTMLLAAFVLTVFTGPMEKMRRIPLGIVFAAVSIFFLIFALTILPLFSDLLALLGKDATITGRTPLWRQIIAVMQKHHTFLGYGFGMFWRDSRAVALVHAGFERNSFMGTMTSGAHNMLLETWMNIGLVGAAALVGMFLYAFRRILDLDPDAYLFCTAVIVTMTMFGLTERVFSDANSYQTVFLFLAAAVGCRYRKEPESARSGSQKN